MIEHRWYPPDSSGSFFDFTRPSAASPFWLRNAGLEGMGDPNYDSFTRQSAVQDGQSFSGYRAGGREVFWPVVIDPEFGSYDYAQRQLWDSLPPGRYGSWAVTGPAGTVRTLRCRFVGNPGYAPDRDPSLEVAEVVGVTLVADDPWWRGPEITETFSVQANPVPFFNTTNTHVLNIMPATATGTRGIDNPGDIDAWPKYVIQGPVTAFEIRTSAAFDQDPDIAGYFNIGSGSTLIIDTDPAAQTITLDGVNAWPQMSFTRFQRISTATGAVIDVELSGTGSLTMSFFPRYRRAY